jgi:phage baseplate assembly protein W
MPTFPAPLPAFDFGPSGPSFGLPASTAANATTGLVNGVDLGQDFAFLSTLDPNFNLIGGTANLGQALAHRLETPRGGLFYDPNYGTDIRDWLNDAMTPRRLAQAAAAIQSECMKDERVLSCTASVQFVFATTTLNVVLNVSTAAGPFQYILAVTSVSVSLLSIGGS